MMALKVLVFVPTGFLLGCYALWKWMAKTPKTQPLRRSDLERYDER